MNTYKKSRYRLETLSAVILSPREQEAFYLNETYKGFKMIYPFYQYGDYKAYNPERAEYYIPGSSVKGAIGEAQIMADDVSVSGGSIDLRCLYKVQNIKEPEEGLQKGVNIRAEAFFPNVGVEMLKAGVRLEGELFCKGNNVKDIIANTHTATMNKLSQWLQQFQMEQCASAIKNEAPKGEKKIPLVQIWKNTSLIYDEYRRDKNKNAAEGEVLSRTDCGNAFLLLLGGYKGKLLSHTFKGEAPDSAVYVDYETRLPHGLAVLELI